MTNQFTYQNRQEIAAEYPHGKELQYHMDLVPHLKIPYAFDAEACFQEATQVLEHFVVHRNYEQSSQDDRSGKWKSLGLRAVFADPSKTQYHMEYQASSSDYQMTEIAGYCPQTMELLKGITDLDKCERIRFMLLEPGARIAVHTDNPNSDFTPAVNIALNMPAGCTFWMDMSPDGSRNEYTHPVPFEAGDIQLLNISKYHFVENNSDVPRIHVIISGPIRFTSQELTQLAREQNKITERRELIKQLIDKKLVIGEDLEKTSDLLFDFESLGYTNQSLPSRIRLLLVGNDLADLNLEKECLHHISWASLFPLDPKIVPVAELDGCLEQIRKEEGEIAVIVAAGTLITDLGGFIINLLKACAELEKSQAVAMGHIMDWPNEPSRLPYLHEQFAIVHLKRWEKIGAPPLGAQYYDPTPFTFPAYSSSQENIHDDYTPMQLTAGDEKPSRQGERWWGTQLLAESIIQGLPVVNLPVNLRETKIYAYPEAKDQPYLQRVRDRVRDILGSAKRKAFFFNNEPPWGYDLPDFHPQVFLTVASGTKPFALLHQYPPATDGKVWTTALQLSIIGSIWYKLNIQENWSSKFWPSRLVKTCPLPNAKCWTTNYTMWWGKPTGAAGNLWAKCFGGYKMKIALNLRKPILSVSMKQS